MFQDGNWRDLTLPVVDDFLPEIEQYLPVSADEALRTGQFLKMPLLTGVATDDGVVSSRNTVRRLI